MTSTTDAPTPAERYVPPAGLGDRAMNRLANGLTRAGVSLFGSRHLRVVGRRSGEVRSTTVNLLDLDGRRYLVAPRGTTHWVRNVRAADGAAELALGRRAEAVALEELTDPTAKVPVLRAYLDRWGWEVGRFFDGVDARSADDEIAAVADGFPVFTVAAR